MEGRVLVLRIKTCDTQNLRFSIIFLKAHLTQTIIFQNSRNTHAYLTLSALSLISAHFGVLRFFSAETQLLGSGNGVSASFEH